MLRLAQQRAWRQTDLAEALNVDPAVVSDLINERRTISAPMAIKLGAVFETEPIYWLTLQSETKLRRLLAKAQGAGP